MTDQMPLEIVQPDDDDNPAVVRPFSASDLIDCSVCQRSNPPNRVNCIYCGRALPGEELRAKLLRPSVRKLPETEDGRSIVITNAVALDAHPDVLSSISELVSLPPRIVTLILQAGRPVPIVRVSEQVEATLVIDHLKAFGIHAIAALDNDIGLLHGPQRNVLGLRFVENHVKFIFAGGEEQAEIPWSDIILMVSGRLLQSKVEFEERKKGADEREVTNSTETSADELVVDIFTVDSPRGYRISSGRFDFSCLGAQMDLITSKNFTRLIELIRRKSPNCNIDDSFSTMRKILDLVWPIEQRNQSTGIKRLAPGRYRTETSLLKNNELQFSRYSHLRKFLVDQGY